MGPRPRGRPAARRRRARHGEDDSAARIGRPADPSEGEPDKLLLLVGSRRAAAELRARLTTLLHREGAPTPRPCTRPVSRWCAPCTRTPSECCGCTPPATATPTTAPRQRRAGRRGARPAGRRAVRLAGRHGAGVGLAGAAAAGDRLAGLRAPSSASCCCARPNAAWGRTSCRRWRAARRAGVGRGRPVLPHLRAGGAAPRSRTAGARRRPPRRRWTPRSWSGPRWTRWRATPSCSPPSAPASATCSSTTRTISIPSRWSSSGSSPAPPTPCCSRRPGPGRAGVPRGGPRRARRRRRPDGPAHRRPPGRPCRPCRRGPARRPAAGRRACPRARTGCRATGDGRSCRGAGVRLGSAGGGLDRGRAAPRAPARRRPVVADGGAVALGPAHAADLAPRAARGRRADRGAARRAADWPASPRSCRCSWCCGTRPGRTSIDADAATALLTSPLGSADPMRLRLVPAPRPPTAARGRARGRRSGSATSPDADRTTGAPPDEVRTTGHRGGRGARRQRPAARRGAARRRPRSAGPARRSARPRDRPAAPRRSAARRRRRRDP